MEPAIIISQNPNDKIFIVHFSGRSGAGVGAIASDPFEFGSNISALFTNLHEILNARRPHQVQPLGIW